MYHCTGVVRVTFKYLKISFFRRRSREENGDCSVVAVYTEPTDITTLFDHRKHILIFSFALIALLFWLSVSFLSVAHSEKQNTDFLQNYVATDKVLRNASIMIAEERSESYWGMGLNGLNNPAQRLTPPRSRTDVAMEEVDRQYASVSALPKYGDNLRFHRAHIESMVNDIQDDVSRLGVIRDAVVHNLNLPITGRDKNLQTDVLAIYSDLVDKLEMLRYAATYASVKQSRATQNLFVISDAAWNIRLANHLLTAVFEGYLASGATARGQALIQANEHLNKLNENINTLRRIDSYANVDSELNALASELVNWHGEFYNERVSDITNAMSKGSVASYGHFEWRRVRREMAEHSEKLLNRIEKITFQSLEKAGKKAKRNLLIDSLLVLLCAGLVCFAYWVVRRVHFQATHDALTSLPNRRAFVDNCHQMVARGTTKNVALIKADLSNFKVINDMFGEDAGDMLLQQVAGRLPTVVSSPHFVSCLGGDEFALLVENTANKENATQIAKKLAETVSGQYQVDGQSIQLKTSVGLACYPEDAKVGADLIKAADLALQESKQTAPGTVTRYNTKIADAFHQRQEMETELGLALERNEFELHYQPQFDVDKQAVEGVEALIRWRHPDRGLVSPFNFIPVAEEAGMMTSIGEWVINEAIRQSVIWKNDEDLHLRMSVNVSVHQFVDGDIVGIIQNALSKAELDPRYFEIEITESVAMFDVGSVIEKLNALHGTGVRIALDDFGTGYSSLSYLRDLPLDTLKIDRSFVTEIDEGCRTQKLLLNSIASMAKQLNLHTVAEGVETNSQLQKVCALGIDTVQGYYYSKPVVADDLPGDVKAIDAEYALDKAA